MKKNPENLLLIIAGPTGTGKSQVALELSKIIPSEIINADSRQFYREIDIGTAKPPVSVFNQTPHHLYSFLSLKDNFSVFDFRQYLESLVPQIWAKKKSAIIVGGSGLYIRAILKGIFDFPQEKKSLQTAIRKQLIAQKTQQLYEKLKNIDPVVAEKIHPNDRVRITRALEVWLITGIPMSQWQSRAKPANFIERAEVFYWLLNMKRDILYNRLDLRTEAMLESGWLEEVKNLIDRGLKDDLSEKAPIGYVELCDYIEGKRPLEQTVEFIKRKMRNYARRQLTWFRKEKDAQWLDVTNLHPSETAKILAEKISKAHGKGNKD
ncbi:MAG: tRNA (adenosine(37)-N6)-dimethylallyltransferase MiaA [Candidatus Ratteibacteria bacterium]